MRYTLRRLRHSLFLLFGVSVLTFAFTELAPGDYLDDLRVDPRISEQTLDELRGRLGMDRSLPVRYLSWLGSTARGDLGYSFAHNSPVAPLLLPRARNTLLLSLLATAMAWAIALPLGIWIADRKRGWPVRITGAATSTLLAVPEILVALALLLLAVRTGWFPTGGMFASDSADLTPLARVADLAHHLILPVTALVLGMLPTLVRHVRASVDEVLGTPFVRAVRGFGIPERRVLWRYALPVAANPLISLFGFSVASLLSASLLVEIVMSWPGIGPFLLEAILARDVFVVIGVVMASTVLLMFGNLAADLLLYAVDPRIRRD